MFHSFLSWYLIPSGCSKSCRETTLYKCLTNTRVSSRWEVPNVKHLYRFSGIFGVPVGWVARVYLVCQASFAFYLAVHVLLLTSCSSYRKVRYRSYLCVRFSILIQFVNCDILFGFCLCAQSYSSVGIVTELWNGRQEHNILIFLIIKPSRCT